LSGVEFLSNFRGTRGNYQDDKKLIAANAVLGASPMWRNDTEEITHPNWIAIFSFAGSAVCSLAIWVGLIRGVQLLVK
jgi:hypothetical protein